MDRCASCKGDVIWRLSTTTGKPTMLDAEPVPGGTIDLIGGRGFRRLEGFDALARGETGELGYTEHRYTCPYHATPRRGLTK